MTSVAGVNAYVAKRLETAAVNLLSLAADLQEETLSLRRSKGGRDPL